MIEAIQDLGPTIIGIATALTVMCVLCNRSERKRAEATRKLLEEIRRHNRLGPRRA